MLPTPTASISPQPTPPARPGRRILLIRPSALGDVARTVPCLVSLRQAYPEAHIDWLVDGAFADAVAGHPMLDGVVLFNRKKKSGVPALLRRLRRAKYDLVFDLQGLARSGLFAWATRAKDRVGYANAAEFGWLGVNHRHHVDKSRHALDRMLALLEAQGVTPVQDLALHVPEEARGFTSALIEHHHLGPAQRLSDQPYVCLAPTAQWGCKCWPADRYSQIAQRLLEADHAPWVAVLAAPHERDHLIQQLSQSIPDALRGRLVYPATTVGQAMDLIEHAALLVCNDSAALHLAVGLNTPTVSLFGPTDPALVGPPPPEAFFGASSKAAPRVPSEPSPQPPSNPSLESPPENDPVLSASEKTSPAEALHRVLRAPSAVGKTFNYRDHRDDNTLIAELSVDTVWAALAEALPR